MTKTPSQAKADSSDNKVPPKVSRSSKAFKPDIRVAQSIVGAIAFLQKSGLQATNRNIKTCILERQRKNVQRSLTELPKYLNRGVELGILKKWCGGYKLGELKIKNRKPKRKYRTKRYGEPMEVIKAVKTQSKSAGQSANSSVAAF